MGKLADALKRKYKTPHEAIRALGLDEALLRSEIVGDSMPLVLREPPGRAYDYGYGFGLSFDAATEAGLKDDEPRDVIGTKGMQNKPFRKRFPNAQAMNRWMDGEGSSGDYDINYIQRA